MNRPRSKKPAPAKIPFVDLRAEDIMRRDLVTIGANAPLREIEQLLADSRISGAPVVDADGRILGIVSASDLVSERAETETADAPSVAHSDADDDFDDAEYTEYVARDGEPVAAQLMSPDILTIAADATVPEIARKMVDQQVHRLLVAEGGAILGLISTMDVLRAVAGSPM